LRQDLGGVTFEALGNDQNYKESNKTQDGQTDFRFRYALRTHSAAYDSAKAAQWSRSYTVPLLVSFGQAAGKPRPQIDLDPARAVATAFKPAEQQGTELRIWETAGRSGPISIGVSGYREVFQTDLLERDLHPVPIVDGKISIELPANGFAAIRVVP
jgi:alpha-mannosidase